MKIDQIDQTYWWWYIWSIGLVYLVYLVTLARHLVHLIHCAFGHPWSAVHLVYLVIRGGVFGQGRWPHLVHLVFSRLPCEQRAAGVGDQANGLT